MNLLNVYQLVMAQLMITVLCEFTRGGPKITVLCLYRQIGGINCCIRLRRKCLDYLLEI